MQYFNTSPSPENNSSPNHSGDMSKIKNEVTQSEVHDVISLTLIVNDTHDQRKVTSIPYEKSLEYQEKSPNHLIVLRSNLFRLLSGTVFGCFCVLLYMIIDHSVDTQILLLLSSICGFTTQFVIHAWSKKDPV